MSSIVLNGLNQVSVKVAQLDLLKISEQFSDSSSYFEAFLLETEVSSLTLLCSVTNVFYVFKPGLQNTAVISLTK